MTKLHVRAIRVATLATLAALWLPAPVYAATLYVAPTGNDTNPGTETAPLATMIRANALARAGDTVYFRAGAYLFTKGTTACSSQTANISGVVLSTNGSAGNLIKYWAFPGEHPVFDFLGIKDSCRIKGISVSASYIHIKGLEIKNVQQNNDLNHESWGIWIQGSNNIFETIDAHHNMGPGIFIEAGSNNLVLNCDSHHNFDEHTSNGAGESADGFGCHIDAGETGNVFRGCRAWWNTDDGYDFINAEASCLVENSWAWYNGYRPDTMTAIGNGNGFKGGGYGLETTSFPASPARHTVRSCLAFANRAAGFYANHHPGPLIFYNNTSYGNNPDFNMLGITSSGASVTVGIYRNNLAFSGTLFSNRTAADEISNSWTAAGVTVTAADFQSVAVTGMDGPRQPDGSLPVLPNFRLAADSDLIDKGTDVGLPFAGVAPDLGAFEVGLPTGSGGGGGTGTGGGAAATGGINGGGGRGGTAAAGGRMGTAGRGPLGSGGGPATGGAGATAAGGQGTKPATGGSTAIAGASGTAGAGAGETGTSGGCACSTSGRVTGATSVVAIGPLVLLLVGLRRPRLRRRRHPSDDAR